MTHHVVVIGGGFCGAMVALHLTRDHPALQVSVTVVEPRPALGAGLAYGTGDPACRTNVAASRMSPFEEAPLAFDDWLVAGGADAADAAMEAPGGRFPARAVFGRYIAAELAQRPVVHRRGQALAAGRTDNGFAVTLDDGGVLHADTLVLATGHPRPALPRPLLALAGSPRLIADPWDESALARVASQPDSRVLIVGTGLTGCDVLASLRRRGHRGPVVAVSRRGLLPRPRTMLPVASFGAFGEAPSRTALGLTRRVRAAVAEVLQLGRPWEDVIGALREQAPAVWRALPLIEQRRLLRHLRAFWDVHRFQCAPQIASLVEAERTAGRLTVHAASLSRAVDAQHAALVMVRQRGNGATLELAADGVVNCTGPGHRSLIGSSPVLASLAAAGLIEADPLGLGLRSDFDNLAVGVDNAPIERLYVAGPPARAAHGELMGLPQVSRQPRAIAGRIAAEVTAGRRAGEKVFVDAPSAR